MQMGRLAIVCIGLCFLLLTTRWSGQMRPAARTLNSPSRLRLRRRQRRLRMTSDPAIYAPISSRAPLMLVPMYANSKPYASPRRAIGLRLAAVALSMIGKPCAPGGRSPDTGFDCAGLVAYALARVGVQAPHTVWQQYRLGRPVASSHLHPGDLLFFSTYASGPTHVGLYVGNGRFVNALDERGCVLLSTLYDPYFATRFLGARSLTGSQTATVR